MKFGRTEAFDQVDYTLPQDDPGNAIRVKSGEPGTSLYMGATGWSMKEWKGKIYPDTAKTNSFLQYYSKQFNSIELNSTHYRLPEEKTIEKWYEESVDDFRFCPKMWNAISHRKDLGLNGPLTAFFDRVSLFKEKLGMIFIQMPPYFGADRMAQLEKLVQHLPSGFKVGIELRHESVYSEDNFKQIIDLLHKHNISLVITDVAGRRDILHSSLIVSYIMVRWVGNGLHESDYERLESWKSRIKSWMKIGVDEIYFFPHQPDNLLTPETAEEFGQRLSDLTGLRMRFPRLLDSNNQLSLL